jgi:hypothetical protein
VATTTRRRRPRKATKPKAAPKAAPPAPALPAPEPPVESALVVVPSAPEATFAARVPPPPPDRPRPTSRRAIFLDVENTSRPQDLAQIMDHLAVNHRDAATDLVAVANWKVVSQDSARMLARMGAHLVHSAPSTGVRDWSDLRIAVAAGIWLAGARAGDAMEIVSDDRAFDAVGDVAATLGIVFRRLSYRRLGRGDGPEPPVHEPRPALGREPRGPRRRGGRGRSGRPAPPRPVHPAPPSPASLVHTIPSAPPDETGPHTAPHDEIVSVVRALVDASATGTTNLDALANALKARGFRRPPGSPRLVTRLRRIRELLVSPRGAIALATDLPGPPPPVEPPPEPLEDTPPPDQPSSAPMDGGGRRRRRRRRRGGRGRHGPSAPPA